jgi:hypothetical protein
LWYLISGVIGHIPVTIEADANMKVEKKSQEFIPRNCYVTIFISNLSNSIFRVFDLGNWSGYFFFFADYQIKRRHASFNLEFQLLSKRVHVLQK